MSLDIQQQQKQQHQKQQQQQQWMNLSFILQQKNMTSDSIKFFNSLHKLFVTFAISDVKVQEVNFILS